MRSKKLIYIAISLIILLSIVVFVYLTIKEDDNKVINKILKRTDEVRIDASPLAQSLIEAYSDGLEEFNISLDYTNTDAYTKLLNEESDLIIVDELNKEENENVEITKVANEGFVFYVNNKNIVSDLTLEQVRKIYSGQITNWKQFGGSDINIIAYQNSLNDDMNMLVMNNIKMKEPSNEEIISNMNVMANNENSIGYSYYSHINNKYKNSNVKILKINGIEPNHDTIKIGTYPIITSYYIVTRKDEKNENVLKLKEAMLSNEGQAIVQNAGYIELGN